MINSGCELLVIASIDGESLGTVLAQAKESFFNSGVVYTVFDEIGLITDAEGAKVYYSSDDKMNTISIFF